MCTHNCSNFAVLVYMPMPLVTCFFLFRCLRVSRKGGPAANSTPPILVGDLLLKVDGKPVDKIHSARDALALLQVSAFEGCKCSQAVACALTYACNTHTHTHTHTHAREHRGPTWKLLSAAKVTSKVCLRACTRAHARPRESTRR